MPGTATTMAYLTLHDGILLDLELTDDNVLVMRAGRSLDPQERVEVLRLTYFDFTAFVEHAIPLFVQRATALYRPLLEMHVLASARHAHLGGATHDCGEWWSAVVGSDAVCAICGKGAGGE